MKKKEQTLSTEVKKKLANCGKSYYALAAEAKMRPSTVQRVKETRWGKQLETAHKLLNAAGYDLVIVKKEG